MGPVAWGIVVVATVGAATAVMFYRRNKMPEITIETATPQLLTSAAVQPLLLSAPPALVIANLQAGGLAFFLMEDAQPRGFVMVTATDELLAFVLVGHHQRGLGTRLAEHAIAEARKSGRTKLHGTVMAGHPGHKLALRLGFAVVSSHQMPNGKTEHVIDLPL